MGAGASCTWNSSGTMLDSVATCPPLEDPQTFIASQSHCQVEKVDEEFIS